MPPVMLLYRIDPQRPALWLLGWAVNHRSVADVYAAAWPRVLVPGTRCRFAPCAILSPSPETALKESCPGQSQMQGQIRVIENKGQAQP
jgi:hypothetical protein